MEPKCQSLKIVALSDLHGYLPLVPECDLLILAGDYSANSRSEWKFLDGKFREWLDDFKGETTVVGVAGNHDLLFQREPHMVPADLNWIYLQDSGCELLGLKFWGSPWQPKFFNWAFNLDESGLAEKWKLIPDDTDILITHGPPYGILDLTPDGRHVGSPSLRDAVDRIQPKLHVFGHIHHSRGVEQSLETRTQFVNAANVDEAYRPVSDKITIDLDVSD